MTTQRVDQVGVVVDDLGAAHTQTPRRQTICLCMIVRDEASIIGRCLRSVGPLIDSWVVVDTGSTDGTQDVIRAALSDVPGELHERPWRDFGANRSELMQLAVGSADYLLLLDADMTVRSTAPLPQLAADSYLLRHDGSYSYWIPRLVRGDLPWRFIGVTHEYLDLDSPHSQERLSSLAVIDHADGRSRGIKLDRDRDLLEARTAEDPTDVRAVFYLAQTYRDRDEPERAIALYRRRVEMGGWDEEVFYSAYQVGVLLARSNWTEAVAALLEAWERRPSRIEPLWELARGYRERGAYNLALLFSSFALNVPEPDDLLFVHRDAYEWGALFEWSIAAGRLGDLEGALTACDELLRREVPPNVVYHVRNNREWCAQRLGTATHPALRKDSAPPHVPTLEVLAPGTRVAEIQLEVEPAWPVFNPSIAADVSGARMLVRSANYVLDDGRYRFLTDEPVVRSLTYMLQLDADLAVRGVTALAVGRPTPELFPVTGYEDCRLFRLGTRWYATASARDFNPEGRCEVVLLEIDGTRLGPPLLLESPDPGRHEKNWMPVADGESLSLIYSCDPVTVYRCDAATGRLRLGASHARRGGFEHLRGGSQGIPFAGGTLAVTHEVMLSSVGRTYLHRFIWFDRDWTLAKTSAVFRFAGHPVEFCCGLAAIGTSLALSFGVDDRSAYVALVDRDAVASLLNMA